MKPNYGIREITFADGSKGMGATVFYLKGKKLYRDDLPGETLKKVYAFFGSLCPRAVVVSIGAHPGRG